MDYESGPQPPSVCPYGHALTAGEVSVAWMPCKCSSARAEHNGHTTWQCQPCARIGRTTTAYEPYHVRTAAEVEAGQQWLRQRLAGAEEALAAATVDWQQESLEAEVARFRRALNYSDQEVAALRSAELTRAQRGSENN